MAKESTRNRFRISKAGVLRRGKRGGKVGTPTREDSHIRVVSMIYLRPTNDIPVNRIAASVIGPVWGSSGL